MLSLSPSVGYAIRGLAQLEANEGQRAFAREIACAAGVPGAYLAKLFKKLADAGIVESKRGWTGGTRLARPATEISLMEVAEAIDGNQWFSQCLLGMDECSEQSSCPTHKFWNTTREAVRAELRRISLSDVVEHQRKSLRPECQTTKP